MEEVKPKTFSRAWWGHFFSALKVWEYDARDVAIWQLSGWQTGAMLFGGSKLIGWVTTTTFYTLVKAMAAKVSAFASALWYALT
jgi:hypothetical protein